MRIGIDVRYLSHGLVGGVHTYIANLVPALLHAAAGHEIVLYADTKCPFELRTLPANTQVRLLAYRNGLSSVQHDWLLRRELATDRIDVAHFPANYGFAPHGCCSVITLHDAINVMPLREIIRGHAKDRRTVVMMTYLHLCSTAALRQADAVLTVSEHAAAEIARHSGYDRRRISAVPHAPTADLHQVTDPAALAAIRARYSLTKPFVLADGLKNPAVLVRAWEQLPETLRDQFQIVFFARREPLPVVRAAEAAGHARLLIWPPREDLIALYSQARAFVFPSWIEGFGIPILEAMTCGAPVIASDRGAIPEVVGDAGVIIDAEDHAALAQQLTQLLTDPHQAEQLRQRGFARAAQFSWQRAAERTLAVYEQVLRAAPRLRRTGLGPQQS